MDQLKKRTRQPSKKLSTKKKLSSRVMNFLGIQNKTNPNPEVVESVVEPFFLGADNQLPCTSRETISQNPELVKSVEAPFFLGADNQLPCTSRETIRKINDPEDNAINYWDTEENLHNLTVDESILSNQEIKQCDVDESSGRRIVDMHYVFSQIKNSVHRGSFGCTFLNMTFISEKKHGFRSSFKFKCDVCNIVMFIDSEKLKPETYLPVNYSAVNGSIAAGIGFTQLSELCAITKY